MRTKTKKHTQDENRTRPVQVHLRMTPKEYEDFHKKLDATGLSAQAFIMKALNDEPIIDTETREQLLDACRSIKDIQKQAKGMGINTNQMARVANTFGNLPAQKELEELTEFNLNTGREVGKICLLLNRLTRKRIPSQD